MERPPLGEVEDLATLAKLDESILLDEIKERYKRDKIYTYVGDILIAVNPFKDLGIYGKDFSKQYHNVKQSTHPPHIFAVADAAYQALIGHGGRPPCSQCILISGESGAGKTESTKLIIKQLVELCKGNTQLEQQILQVNPLLEAFGNAQTNLNDNSSRFGKYIQLKFRNGHLVGGKISEYLLEKSRVVRQNVGEENFHIFYYLFASKSHESFGLGDPNQYRYLTNGAGDFNHRLSTLNRQYEDLVNAMDLVGFTDEEQHNLFAIISGLLHLGNINFDVSDSDDSVSVMDNSGPVAKAAKLLGIDVSEIEGCLTCMVTVTKGEYVKRNYTMSQAEDARDAMAKTVYGRLFGWIANKINCLMVPEGRDSNNILSEIGILDIFGFEDFTKDTGKNSFEQACINLANEQLQFFFNQHIFRMEQEEYKREGIDWTEISFVDNKPLLDLFLAKPIGVLSLLDEESLFPKGTDQSYVDKLTKAFNENAYFTKSQQTNKAVFSINHYAGKVIYSADGWLEKNRDTLPPGITELLQSSENVLVKTIFRGQITRTGSLALQGRTVSRKHNKNIVRANSGSDAATRKLTVGGQFKNSLSILMERMMSSTPIFVRCLKPNHLKAPGDLDSRYVLAQLLYTGMLETVEIRRKGFAVRPSFANFVEKYKILVDLKLPGTAQSCSTILSGAKVHGWCLGKSKLFLKYSHIEQLTELLDSMGKSAVHLQRVVRGFLARREFRVKKEHARREKEAIEEMLLKAKQLSDETMESLNGLNVHDKSRPKGKVQPGKLSPAVPYFDPNAVSLASSCKYLEPVKKTATTGTQMEESLGSDSEIVDDDFQPVADLQRFGRSGTKEAAVTWFKETQTYNVMEQNQNRFAEWFHGIISRKEAEALLKDRIIGCYLIRVSESRFGYTLTFKAERRCRHYMIDQLKNGKFIVIGEPKVHRSLHDLVNYHKKVKISNWDHFLTVPCGQIQGECDYSELVSPDVYFSLDETSIQQPPTVSAASSNIRPLSEDAKKRPLPKVPEEAYNKLVNGQDEQHKYNPLESEQPKGKTRVSASRKKL